MKTGCLAALSLYFFLAPLPLKAHAEPLIPVTIDNFIRAETDHYFSHALEDAGGLATFAHHRELMPVDRQTVIRPNRDTFYSAAVVDLDGGPVTVTLPYEGTRYRAMEVLNEDHYVVGDVVYRAGMYAYNRKSVGTRYALIAVRTLGDPNDPHDLQQVHVLQDATTLSQLGSTGSFEIPNWDESNRLKLRDALITLAATLPDFKHAFGARDDVDPVRRILGAAAAWGGSPDKDAVYLNVIPPKNDGTTVHTLTVKDVPVDGFWSVSVYNEQGYFENNRYDAYSKNNLTSKKNVDGSITIQFGGCDGSIPNCLPIVQGWNYMVRLYRPRPEILNGKWTFPEAAPLKGSP
jgi:hypothetical protein